MEILLADISLEDLMQELERRNFLVSLKKKTPVLLQVENPDFTNVANLCQEYIDDISSRGWAGGDYKDYMFEAAMIAVFGSDVWDWVSDRKDQGDHG